MSVESGMVNQRFGERVTGGSSPTLRKRRTRQYIPNSRIKQRAEVLGANTKIQNASGKIVTLDLGYDLAGLEKGLSASLYRDQNMNNVCSHPKDGKDVSLKAPLENSQLGDRYQILKAENKILRERLQNALQREMKALKTFKRLAKENRQLKVVVAKYEKTLLGIYSEDSDSDYSDHLREIDSSQEYKRILNNDGSKRSYIVRDIPLRKSKSYEALLDQPCYQRFRQTEVTRTASTSTEDLHPLTTADKSTSTDGLGYFIEQTLASVSSEFDSYGWVGSNYSNGQENLTDATKVKVLTQQIQALENQSVKERRKFSSTQRYRPDPLLLDNGQRTNSLHKASSSPNILDASQRDFKFTFQTTEERRVFDEQAFPEFPSRFRNDSFNDEPFGTQAESILTESSSNHLNNSPESRSSSSSSEIDSPQAILNYVHEDSTPQRSRNTSPLSIDEVIGSPPKNVTNIQVKQSSELGPSPQASPGSSPKLSRRKLGQSHSLPPASMKEYVARMRRCGDLKSKPEGEDVEEEDEYEFEDLSMRDNHDEDIFRRKRDRKNRLTDNTRDMAADIASFLQYRERCQTLPSKGLGEEKDDESEDIQTSEAMALSGAKAISRRRGSAVVSFPDGNYKMDLHVLGKNRQALGTRTSLKRSGLSSSTNSLNSIDAERKSRWSILRRNKKFLSTQREREKQIVDFKEYLAKLNENPRAILQHELQDYKETHWTQLMAPYRGNGITRRPLSDGASSDQEMKRREALWELCHSEIVYTLDHLLVLKEVFLDTLRNIQQMGHLQNIDSHILFCNVEELVKVSTKFAKDLLLVFQNEHPGLFGSTAAVVSAFTEFGWKVHPQYQKYCLNYSRALGYLDTLKKSEDFQEFLKWCESDPRCNRLQVSDLLVAPLQHLTKYPLLLKNIRRRTPETEGKDGEHNSLSTIIKSVELSIQELETKVKSGANLERLQELQKNLVWPAITELDSKAFIPEFLRPVISRQPCENLLASPNRQLLYEGLLILHENTKVEVYAFLFDDMLLLTRFRKKEQTKAKKMSFAGMTMSNVNADSPPGTPNVSGFHTVYKQPIPLDRFIIYDAEYTQAGSTIKNSFVIIHYSRFKQTIGVFTLQAPSQNLKEKWTGKLKAAQSSWSDSVVQELAAESQKLMRAAAVTKPIQEEILPNQKSEQKSEETEEANETSQMETLSHKPIESQC